MDDPDKLGFSTPALYQSLIVANSQTLEASCLRPGQWIRSGCLVVNLKLSLMSSNIVIECSCATKCCMGARQQRYANLDTSILDIAML